MFTKILTGRFTDTGAAGRRLGLAGAGMALLLCGVTGCTHGSDDTGGGSSAGSMSGVTGMQGTQGIANRQGTPPGGGPNPAPPAANVNGNGANMNGGGMGATGGASGGANAAPTTNSGG